MLHKFSALQRLFNFKTLKILKLREALISCHVPLGWVEKTLSSIAMGSPIPSATVAKYSPIPTDGFTDTLAELICVTLVRISQKGHKCLMELTQLVLKLSGLLFPICPYCLSPDLALVSLLA